MKHKWTLKFIASLVVATGILIIASVLFAQTRLHRIKIVSLDAHLTLLVGISLIYLASLLSKGKRSAWNITIILYSYILIRDTRHFAFDLPLHIVHPNLPFIVLNLLLPVIAFIGLLVSRNLFTVKSEVRNATIALRRAVLILSVALLFGVIGIHTLDERDFHQDISIPMSFHYTVDQFGLTTNKQLVPYTRQARLFLDSLSFISTGAMIYVIIAFFAPIRFKLIGHEHEAQEMAELLKNNPSNSEDFFKLWPKDKAYFFSDNRGAALAYRTVGGSALCVGDPAGNQHDFHRLLESFIEYCYVNDWDPTFIHTEDQNSALYKRLGFELQKVGEEAVVNIDNFIKNVSSSKYFRHINKKFTDSKYKCEVLTPPHDQSTMKQLQHVSDDWLKVPGRTERTFMMGYFDEAYMQQCKIMVIRDEAGDIKAFINQLPDMELSEANFDLLRHTRNSPGNINDFLLINFINHLKVAGFKKLNLGLCPLAGLEENTSKGANLDNFLRLIYAGGNRFYSFKGLRRFKAKYEPEWCNRYIVYRGGFRGFTLTSNSLLKAMRLKN